MYALFVKGDNGWEPPRLTDNKDDVIEFVFSYHDSAFLYLVVSLDERRIINNLRGE